MPEGRLGIVWVVVLAAVLAFSTKGAYAQSKSTDLTNLWIERLQSREWVDRSGAFYAVVAQDLTTDETKVAVTRLLVMENSFVHLHAVLDEAYFEYYIDVVDAVSSLEDARALDALLGCMTTGDIATKGIARLGEVALDKVILSLDAPSIHVRQAAAITLSEMLDPKLKEKLVDNRSPERIKRALLKAASDEYPYVRMSAIEGLAKIDGPDVRTLLKRLALEDPYEASAHGGDKSVYPVREVARSLLSTSP